MAEDMDTFLQGFADELSKIAEADVGPSMGKKLKELGLANKSTLKRLGGSTAGYAAIHKLIDPDASLSGALGSGLAVTGGGEAGQAAARHMGLGRRGSAGLSLLGSVLGLRAMSSRKKKKAKEKREAERRAREKLMAEAAAKQMRR